MKLNLIMMAMILVIAGCGKQKEADTNTKADVKAKTKSADNLGIPFGDDDTVLKQLKKDNPTPDQSRANVLATQPHAHYSGTVLSAKGTPVPGASVLVYAAGTKVKGKLFKGESAGTTKFASFLDLTSAVVDASTTGWGLQARNAFDNNKTGTRWSSVAGTLPPSPTAKSGVHQWIWVDLGVDLPVRSVWVDFQNSAAVDYTVRLLTKAQGNTLGLAKDGKAGGGPDKWKIIATGTNLPNGNLSQSRRFPGFADKWNFVNGTAVIPEIGVVMGAEGRGPRNLTGKAEVNVTNPVGRYIMVDTTKASDPHAGNVSIWEITVEAEARNSKVPIKHVVYATATDNFSERYNPITTDANGKFSFFVANGDYDIHVSHASVNYSLTGLALVNPNAPHSIRSSSKTPPLTLIQRGEKTSTGNNVFSLDRPGSKDGNNPGTPYRFIVNKGQQGWAQTKNADWNEITNTWNKRTIGNASYVFRINGDDHSLEYGNDYFATLTSPVMETLFRVSAEGQVSAKAFSGGHEGLAMEVKNNTGGNLDIGNVVVLDPSDPFGVIKPRKFADENPMVIFRREGSRVFVLISGRMVPNTAGAISIGDLLVAQGAGSLKAVAAPVGVDPRAIIGKVSTTSRFTIIP